MHVAVVVCFSLGVLIVSGCPAFQNQLQDSTLGANIRVRLDSEIV